MKLEKFGFEFLHYFWIMLLFGNSFILVQIGILCICYLSARGQQILPRLSLVVPGILIGVCLLDYLICIKYAITHHSFTELLTRLNSSSTFPDNKLLCSGMLSYGMPDGRLTAIPASLLLYILPFWLFAKINEPSDKQA
jgi:hypothetical protein